MTGAMEIGLVGVGPWGKHILRDLCTLGARVHTVARSPESIGRARTGGAASVVDDPDLLPRSCAGYVVANRTISHLDAVEALLPRGRPIFVEKPLAPDLERIEQLPPEAHQLVFIMHKWRYHPGVIELARIARSRTYGAPLGLRTYRAGWGNPHDDVRALWILAPHDFSIALAVLGEVPRVVSAAADAIGAGDGAIAQLRTRAGLPVTMELSAAHPTSLRRILLRCRDAVCQLDSADYGAVTVKHIDSGRSETIRV
ncbi:MAG: Gfo/Idh/MocA family protein, partial [Vitreimonas sp.]